MDPTVPVDRSTNAPSILAVNGVFCGIIVVVMALRMYVRAVMLKTVGVDDWLILAATVITTFLFGESIAVSKGARANDMVAATDNGKTINHYVCSRENYNCCIST